MAKFFQIVSFTRGDIQYISRLVRLVRHFVPASVLDPSKTGYIHGRCCLLPFDAYHDPETGERDMERTTMVRLYTCFQYNTVAWVTL